MEISKPITELIQSRFSCRTYEPVKIDDTTKNKIIKFLSETTQGPFGNISRFQLIENSTYVEKEKIGTYGFISGADIFIAGATKPGKLSQVDFGYLMEKIILFVTDFGLGTCWLGGTLNRNDLAKKMGLQNGEIIPAMTPVGYIKDKQRLSEKTLRWMIGATRRKPWQELFFENEFGNPLSKESAGEYAQPLEMVRLGPSASNKQPWRIVWEANKKAFHFYLQRNKTIDKSSQNMNVDLQFIDMGIALCHFELTTRELDLSGQWSILSTIQVEGVDYIASWKI
jgi:hypothetical protein